MKQDSSSKFFRAELSSEEERSAMNVSPLFLLYLQNKVEAYASALVEARLPYAPNPAEQVTAILAHERLRNFCEAYEELLAELLQSAETPKESAQLF